MNRKLLTSLLVNTAVIAALFIPASYLLSRYAIGAFFVLALGIALLHVSIRRWHISLAGLAVPIITLCYIAFLTVEYIFNYGLTYTYLVH